MSSKTHVLQDSKLGLQHVSSRFMLVAKPSPLQHIAWVNDKGVQVCFLCLCTCVFAFFPILVCSCALVTSV